MKEKILNDIKIGKMQVVIDVYISNGNTAVNLIAEDGRPCCSLTVNVVPLDYGLAALDTNNCPWVKDFIEDNGLGEFVKYVSFGFSTYPYPVYKLDIDKLKTLGKKE